MKDAIEKKVERKRKGIEEDLRDLGKRLAAGDDRQLLVWVIPNRLACAQRPLRFHPKFGKEVLERNELYGRPDLPPEARDEVLKWVGRIKEDYGIQSIISLMGDDEMRRYAQLDLGPKSIIGLYEESGLKVRHIRWKDPAYLHTSPIQEQERLARNREKALCAFDELPKPVLLHCSAGIQRSSPVAAYIWAKREGVCSLSPR